MRLKGHVIPFIISLVFFIVGVGILCLSMTWVVDETHYKTATATVISAEVSYSESGKLVAVSTYEYFVDGERYVKKTAATSASSAKLEGETFTVKYDPDEPDSVHRSGLTPYFMVAFGLIFTCVGGGLTIALLTGKLN